MRPGQQNRRGRGRNNNNNNNNNHHGNRKQQNPLSRSFESNGPDVKVRGTPAHIAEKYMTLARDAQSSGDPVLAENYLQHAEHYNRIIMAYREQLQQNGDATGGNIQPQRFRPVGDEEGDEISDDESGNETNSYEAGTTNPAVGAQQPAMDRPEGSQSERPQRNDRFEPRPDRQGGNNPQYQNRDRNFGGQQYENRGDRNNNDRQQFRRDRDNRFNDRPRHNNDPRFRDQQGGDRNFNRDNDRRFEQRDRPQGGYNRDFNRDNDRPQQDRGNDDRGIATDRPPQDRQAERQGGERPPFDRHGERSDRHHRDRDRDRGERDRHPPQAAPQPTVDREPPTYRDPMAEPLPERIAPVPAERAAERRPEPIVESAPVAPADNIPATVAAKPAARRRTAPAPAAGERFQEHDQPTFLRRAPRRTKAEAKVDGDAPTDTDTTKSSE